MHSMLWFSQLSADDIIDTHYVIFLRSKSFSLQKSSTFISGSIVSKL